MQYLRPVDVAQDRRAIAAIEREWLEVSAQIKAQGGTDPDLLDLAYLLFQQITYTKNELHRARVRYERGNLHRRAVDRQLGAGLRQLEIHANNALGKV